MGLSFGNWGVRTFIKVAALFHRDMDVMGRDTFKVVQFKNTRPSTIFQELAPINVYNVFIPFKKDTNVAINVYRGRVTFTYYFKDSLG